MALEEIGVQQGTVAELDSGMKIGLVSARDGRDDAPPEIVLFIKDDGERDVILHPGDAFAIGAQEWRFERVVKAGGNRLGAVFARIE